MLLLNFLFSAIALIIAALSAWFTYQQIPEKKAILHLEVVMLQLIPRAPGEWLLAPTIAVKNEGASKAEKIIMEYQHWPLSWTGLLPFQDTFEIAPNDTRMIFVSADTVADPQGLLSSGKHLYSVVRAKWTNSSTGRSACKVYYLDIRLAHGPAVGARLPIIDVISERPSTLAPPEIANCPA